MRYCLLALFFPLAAQAQPVVYTAPLTTSVSTVSAYALSAASATITNLAASTVAITQNGTSVYAGQYPSTPLLLLGNTNTYFQQIMQNLSNGTNASSDFILVGDLGGDTSYYLDIGLNSSKFSQAQQTAEASSSTFVASSDSDLLIWAQTNGGLNGSVNGRVIFGSSVPVTANASVMISSVGAVIGSLTQIGAPLDVVSTTQGLGVPVLTTGQVQASTPKKAGQMIFNSTLGLPCYSTGTTVEAYSRFTGTTTCQ